VTAREFHPTAADAETAFAAADADLGARLRRILPGRHTKLVRIGDDMIAVALHDSYVVIYHADGAIEVSTSGFRGHRGGQGSITTRVRIQTYAPGFRQLWESKRLWYVRLEGYPQPLRFVDGMRLHPDGVLVYPGETHLEAVARRAAPPPPPAATPSRARRRRRYPHHDGQLTLARVA